MKLLAKFMERIHRHIAYERLVCWDGDGDGNACICNRAVVVSEVLPGLHLELPLRNPDQRNPGNPSGMFRAILPVLLKTGGPQAPMTWTAMGCSMLVLFRTSQLAPTPSISTTPATPPFQIMVSIFSLGTLLLF
jgi:hypothetical protein